MAVIGSMVCDLSGSLSHQAVIPFMQRLRQGRMGMVWAGLSEPVLSAESAVLLPPKPGPSRLAGPSESHTAEVTRKCLLGLEASPEAL